LNCEIFSLSILTDLLVYLGDLNGKFYGLNKFTVIKICIYSAPHTIASNPIIFGGKIYLACDVGNVYSIY